MFSSLKSHLGLRPSSFWLSRPQQQGSTAAAPTWEKQEGRWAAKRWMRKTLLHPF